MKIPRNWKDITLPIFEAAYRVEQDQYDDEIDRQIDWLAAVTQCSREDIAAMNLKELADLKNKLQWITRPKFNERIPKFFTAGNRLWEVTTEVDKLTAAQYAELCTWMKQDPMMNLDKVMASLTTRRRWWLFRSVYDGSTHSERAAIFRKGLNMAIIYPVALFFFRVFTRSMDDIRASLDRQKHQATKELIQELREAIENARHGTVS